MFQLVAVEGRLFVHNQLQVVKGNIQFRFGDRQQAGSVEDQRDRG